MLIGQKELGLEDLRYIVEALAEVKLKWLQIGLQLGVSPSTLECIEGQCSKDFDKALYEMIKEWLKLMSDQPHTWNDIVKALRLKSVNEGKLADKVEKELISPMTGMYMYNNYYAYSITENTAMISRVYWVIISLSTHGANSTSCQVCVMHACQIYCRN